MDSESALLGLENRRIPSFAFGNRVPVYIKQAFAASSPPPEIVASEHAVASEPAPAQAVFVPPDLT